MTAPVPSGEGPAEGATSGAPTEAEVKRLTRERDEALDWAEQWHRAVEVILTMANLSPALGGVEAANAMQAWMAERDRRLAATERGLDGVRVGKVHATRERERHGVRLAIDWLHRRAREMRDSHARAVLDSVATNLGWDLARHEDPNAGLAAQLRALAEGGR